jgi:hypothetical protein
MRARHVKVMPPPELGPEAHYSMPWCVACGQVWPCDFTVLDSQGADLRAELRDVLDRVLAGIDAKPIDPKYRATKAYTDGWRDAITAIRDDPALSQSVPTPEPLTVECDNCGGQGWVAGIGADPLPSGEPGEPYQVQEPCADCGGHGFYAAPVENAALSEPAS